MKRLLSLAAGLILCSHLVAQTTYVENQFAGPQAGASLWISEKARVGGDWTGTRGTIGLHAGTALNAGYLEFLRPNGVRKGYIGYGEDNFIYYAAENGAAHSFNSGNVGIGMDTYPAAKLHVVGGGYTNDLAAMGNSSTFRIDVANPAISLGIGYNTRDLPVIQSYNNVGSHPIDLQLNPYGGNISIGTTSAQGYKLAVAGAMIAERIQVKQVANWPDYVFSETYALPSLASLERYIREHSHLPGIPSAKEVAANGMDLTEINAILLKKLEEQALYILELNRRIEALEKKTP